MTATSRTRADAPSPAALGPVREALLDHARADGDDLVRRARQEADDLIARASAEAREVSARAAAEGEADAAAALATEQARARRRARAVVLAGEAQAYEALRDRVRSQAQELADDPQAWPRRRAALERLARQSLGADTDADAGDARIEPLPHGVRATSGSRSITLTLADLADAAVDALGADVEELWRP